MDALSRRYALVNTLSCNMLGLEYLKELCASDIDFGEIYAKCGTSKAGKQVFRLDDEYLDKEELK